MIKEQIRTTSAMPQTRSKAKSHRRVQVDDDDSSAPGSSAVRDKIEVSSQFFKIYSCLSIRVSFLRVGLCRRGSGGRTETKTTD